MNSTSLYQDSISQSLNAVMEERTTPQLIMPVLNQATSKTTPKKPRAKRKPKVKQEPGVKTEPTDWGAFDANAVQLQDGCDIPIKKLKQEKITDHLPKTKRKHDRFNGMPEEEVALRLLPDHLAENLDILIVGINPGLFAAYVGHHYAGPGNHFWKCIYLSGLIPEPMNAYDDFKLIEHGIGFTNICARTTRGSADLKKPEIQEGARILKEKLLKYKPKIAAFNGKGIYEIFVGHKKFSIGKQPEPLDGTDTVVYVMPSSSARCAQLPRAVDKVPFYEALKKLRDHIKAGKLQELDDADVTFPTLELKIKKEEPVDDGYVKAEQADGETKPKAKPKKRRSRKSIEATVTSGEITAPYTGEVTQPYSVAVGQNGQTVPYIKQEPGLSSYQPNSNGCHVPYTTQSMMVPNTMASNFHMSQSYSQAPYPQYPMQPPYMNPFNPQMTLAPASTYNSSLPYTQSLNNNGSPVVTPSTPMSHVSNPAMSNQSGQMSSEGPENLSLSSNKSPNGSPSSVHNSPTSTSSSVHNSPTWKSQINSSVTSPQTPTIPYSNQNQFNPSSTHASPVSTCHPTTFALTSAFNAPTTYSPTFNPQMSHPTSYPHVPMGHMGSNGFLPNMNFPSSGWNPFYSGQYYPHVVNPHLMNGTQNSQGVVRDTNTDGGSPNSINESSDDADNSSSKQSSPSSVPKIKSEPEDSGYGLTNL